MNTDGQNQAWREHLQTLIADGTLTPTTERTRLPGCKCPFPRLAPEHHATNCIHYPTQETTMTTPISAAFIQASRDKADQEAADDRARVQKLPADHAPIHRCDESQQPDIHLLCSDTWTTPKWASEADKDTGITGVFVADTDDLYTFREALVTCPDCKVAANTMAACSCPSPTQIPDGGHPRSCPRYEPPSDEERCGNCGRVSANLWCCADGPHGLESITESVRLMRQRQDSGQGTTASAMCQLSLPMAEELLRQLAEVTNERDIERARVQGQGIGMMMAAQTMRTLVPDADPTAHISTLADLLLKRLQREDTGASSGGVARTMKSLNPDGEMELLIVVDGETASVWLSREWWQAATPSEWQREDASTTWSSTPIASGDMLARTRRYVGMTATGANVYKMAKFVLQDDGEIAGRRIWLRNHPPVGDSWTWQALAEEGAERNGWEFRPLDSAPAPGIHQAAMEERMHTVNYRLDGLRHCIRSPGTNLVRGQHLAETLANDAHWFKLLADELLVKEVCADAGQVYDDLAEDSMRAVVAWQGS